MLKVKVLVEYEVEIPVKVGEAVRLYPDCLWPREALALDKIQEIGLTKLLNNNGTAKVQDVKIDD